MDYIFLQNYWWFLVSLLGALLVFLLFVQGGNSLLFTLGRNDEERTLLVNSRGASGNSLSLHWSLSAEPSSLPFHCSTVQVSAELTGYG